MTNQQILEKAIQKALDNGWLDAHKMKSFKGWVIDLECYGEESCWAEVQQDYLKSKWQRPKTMYRWECDEQLIFNHDFAKALWGESDKPMASDPTKMVRYEHWKHHLQQMVVAEDPIKYLGEHTDD